MLTLTDYPIDERGPCSIQKGFTTRHQSLATFLFLCAASYCNGFSSLPHNAHNPLTKFNPASRHRYCKSTAQDINRMGRLYIKTESSDASSSTQDDQLFFAQDLIEIDETDAPSVPIDSAQNSDGAFFYAQQTPRKSQASDGMDAYDAQFFALNTQMTDSTQEFESDNTAQYYDDSWEANQSQAPPEEREETFTNAQFSSSDSSSKPISSVDARVLESILQEGKLDLTTEEQVKKLLEGPRIPEDESVKDSGSSEYSSKFVSVSLWTCQ